MKDRNVRKNHKKLFGILAGIAVIFVILFYVALTRSGHWLIQEDSFKHVKWAVILDGQTADLERNDFAATLMAKGKIDSIIILGRRVYRTKSNADYYAEDFMQLGKFDDGAVFLARHDDPSTLSEAYTIIPSLKMDAPHNGSPGHQARRTHFPDAFGRKSRLHFCRHSSSPVLCRLLVLQQGIAQELAP